MHRAETDLEKGTNITREREEEEEDQRERTSYIDYLYTTSLLCNPVLRRKGDEALSLL